MRFTADDGCMDVTQSHTVNIVSDLDMRPCQRFSSLPAYGEKTVRFSADDAVMDVTKSHTVSIASGFDAQSHPNLQSLPACGEKTLRFNADDAAMDVTKSYTVNIATGLDFHPRKTGDFLPSSREKTVRFSTNDAAMDVTQSHTVNIVTGFDSQPHPNVPSLPAYGEKTLRFNANDADMDVTKSHTVNIATGLDSHQRQDFDIPVCGEKTVRFGAKDAAMDVTKSHTVNIATGLGLYPHKNGDFLPSSGEKTVRFNTSDAAMDVTQCHTIDIATGFNPQAHQSMDVLSACGEKTVTFPANAAAMDVTQSHTVNIACNSATDSLLPQRDSTILSSQKKKDVPLFATNRKSEVSCPGGPSSARTLDPGFKSSLSKRSGTWANPVIRKAVPAALAPAESEDTEGVQDYVAAQREAPVLVNSVTENPERKVMVNCPEQDVRVAEAQADHSLGKKCADESPHCAPSTQLLYSPGNMTETKATSPKGNGSSSQDCEEITNHKVNSNESNNKEEHEARTQTCSPESADHVDVGPSRKSKRMSFADLQTKIRRLSHMIHTAPDAVATEGCTAPLPQPEHDLDPNSKDKTQSQPVKERELTMASGEHKEDHQAHCSMEEEPTTNASTTPFKLKSKQLVSRLSMGGFKPKLPQRSKPNDAEKVNSAGEQTRTITVSVTNQLQGFDADVSDIYDEELGSCEDISEMLETKSLHKATEKVSPSQEFYMDGVLEDVFEEESTSGVNGKKKLLRLDENTTEDEKRLRASTQMAAEIDMVR